MENSTKKIICPVCDESDGSPMGSKQGFHLYRSASCGLVFVAPVPKSEDIYGEEYFHGAAHGFGYVDYNREKEAMHSTFARYVKEISKLYPVKKLFDIGAASGYFVAFAKNCGWEASGIEISDAAAHEGRSLNRPIQTGTIHQVPDGKFDVITMWDVLEHVLDPRADIRRAGELLLPSGILAINTPDAGSWWARMLGIRWQLIVPPEHIHLFTKTALNILLEENGFKIVRSAKIGKSFPLPYILSIGSQWLHMPLLGKFSRWLNTSFLSRISIPINLRDNMFIIAQKVPQNQVI